MKKLLIALCFICLLTVGCAKKNSIDDNRIIVGASPSPHAEILELCRPFIEEAGYELVIVEYTDYVLPNTSLWNGDLDANFFQHQPYLTQFNESNKTDLSSVLAVHFEPLGLYRGLGQPLESIASGSRIAIPNDATNCARALHLLAQLGLIQIDTQKGLLATENDITFNPISLQIIALEAASIPAQLVGFDYGVINGNYVLSSGINISTLLATEDPNSLAAETYANILVVKTGNEQSASIQVLIDALSQNLIAEYILSHYNGLVLPVE
ncbi:MAG: MetQ/NlpA family ABC transporter substrate-binding protein [Bacilli bacterium]|nr:MetQ/NlpA family ABC transporter substrate-binding protein [Bacilli bacterium]